MIARIFGRYYLCIRICCYRVFLECKSYRWNSCLHYTWTKLVVTEESFSATFKLPNEVMPNFASIQNETIAEMRNRFSATEGMVQNPKKQSQGYTVPVSMFMAILVKADLGPSIKLNAKKVLTSKQVESFIKTNQGITPTEDTTSNNEGGTSQNSQPVPPEVTKSLAGATKTNVSNLKKRKHKSGGKKTQPKPVATQVTTPAP
ncbi:hypothetical protein F511_16724 [Dorcoceras hygrometricum]|uniref:Uncharacterized protein n=1 Tax=Dorcoceras hygrometricum TaxID=472368 RepID=A0A2Z7BB55_9LAMI|nr:hypothetical protein F511_16724 [Dorcoceras hygrometricum]